MGRPRGALSEIPQARCGNGDRARTIHGLTIYQTKYKANRLNGMTRYAAAVAAGYSPRTAGQMAWHCEKRFGDSIRQALVKAGASDEELAGRIVK